VNERDLVFIGGGHTHALVLRMLAMNPIKNVRLTLISESILTPYSGMLPGYLAGHYSLDETHLDLNKLCLAANVRFIHDSVTGLDIENKAIQLKHHADIRYDKVSINTGSTPNLTVPGAKEFALGVKPISRLTKSWRELLQQETLNKTPHWAIVGGGAAGVEVVLAIAHRFKQLNKPLKLSLVHSGQQVMPTYHSGIRKRVENALAAAGIERHPFFSVQEVTAKSLVSDQGKSLAIDNSIWCTPANAPQWPRTAGLDVDHNGFIAVNAYLQSTSHADVFACGDVSAMVQDPRPKAGVYAVRSAPFLFANLHATFSASAMKPLKLQNDFLSLIALGGQSAVGQRNGIAFSGKWVWRWKDSIDRKFMALFSEKLPRMANMNDDVIHCAGCGSKLGPELLSETLTELSDGVETPAEDAAIAHKTPEQTVWQSIDGFRSFSDDYYNLGKVITHHAVNDCYAMGIAPTTAQVWVNLAFSHARIARRDFKFLMSGIKDALREHETQLIGGHSTEGVETHVGLVVNGEGRDVWPKNGLQLGDWLMLNKPLGSGILLAANMQMKAHALAVEDLWKNLLHSNREFFTLLKGLEVHAATDVTGFGLIGHLLEMTDQSLFGIDLTADKVPFLVDALELSQQGIGSSLLPQLMPLKHRCEVINTDTARVNALFDPQTQGGLLVSVPPNVGMTLLKTESATRVGTVVERGKRALTIK
jgi:selenide,water dikinase